MVINWCVSVRESISSSGGRPGKERGLGRDWEGEVPIGCIMAMQSERGVPNSSPATSASTANSNSNRQQPTANSENERTNEWLLTERREVDKAVRVHNSHIEHALRQWMLQSGVTFDDLRCLPVLSCPVLPVLSGSVCLSAGLTASLSPTPSLSQRRERERSAMVRGMDEEKMQRAQPWRHRRPVCPADIPPTYFLQVTSTAVPVYCGSCHAASCCFSCCTLHCSSRLPTYLVSSAHTIHLTLSYTTLLLVSFSFLSEHSPISYLHYLGTYIQSHHIIRIPPPVPNIHPTSQPAIQPSNSSAAAAVAAVAVVAAVVSCKARE